jgi:hypothetical protein
MLAGCSFAVLPAYTQERFAKEWAITTENDAFLLNYSDAYYTNGIFFRYSIADKSKPFKRIHQFEVGQQIFTPLSKTGADIKQIDRPYSGFLFGRYSQLNTTRRNDLFSWQVTLGAVGPISLAEQLQNSYHNLFNYKRFEGWRYQVRNAIGVDAGIRYAKSLLQVAHAFRVSPQVEAQAGTNFTGAKLSTVFALGQSNDVTSSAFFNTRTSSNTTTPQKRTEIFAFWAPSILLQAYNATLQGNLLHKGTGAVLASPSTWVWEQRMGICLAANRFSTRIEFIYQSKETPAQKRAHSFGSLQFAYCLF